MTKIKIFKLFT